MTLLSLDSRNRQAGPARADGLEPVLLKLIEILEEENKILRENRSASHGMFTDRKNQALRELMAAQKSLDIDTARSSLLPLLSRLKTVLRLNASLLKRHITALGEVSDIIIGSMRDAESDGTYSRARGYDRR